MPKKIKISYKKYFADIRKRDNFGKLTSKEFGLFIKKFCGTLVYKGKKSYSIKVFNYLLYNLKKQFKQDPTALFYIVANKLMPVFVVGQKQYFGNVVDIPVLARGNKKNLYMLN
jgi:ribosomal protein S7